MALITSEWTTLMRHLFSPRTKWPSSSPRADTSRCATRVEAADDHCSQDGPPERTPLSSFSPLHSSPVGDDALNEERVPHGSASPIESDEALRKELEAVSRRLDTYAFRQTNARIYVLLRSPEGKALSQETREHLEQRTILNVTEALNADTEALELFLREHELEWILEKRAHPCIYAVESTLISSSDKPEEQHV